ncbi:MAG: ABC transporter substrate-binding protein [Dehalococcoidia bacterium]
MSRKGTWCKFLAILLVLVLLVPIVAACGDDDEEETPTPVATTPAATTPAKTTPAVTTPTATTPAVTTSDKPVKVAAVCAWSGYGAGASFLADATIDLVNWQVEKAGGVRVGNVYRPLNIIKYDMESSVAGASKQAVKAITQDRVSALTMGGLTGADGIAIADVAKNYDVLYVHYMGDQSLNDNYSNTINATLSQQVNITDPVKFVLEELKPKTAAYMAQDSSQERAITDAQQKLLEAAGVKTVYKSYYAVGTTDFSPILTRVKYEKPDIIMSFATMSALKSIYKQIMDLGGWGDMKYFGTSQAASGKEVISVGPGANGTICTAYWLPTLDTPASKAFVADWQAYAASHPDWAKKYGTMPTVNNIPFYHCLWLAIKAIELAGTTDDPAAISKTARSGNLIWDAPAGKLTITKDGYSGQHPIICSVKDNQLVIEKWYQGQ